MLCSMQKSNVNYHSRKNVRSDAVSWAIPTHSVSMGKIWGALVPQGYNVYPTAGYVLAHLDSLLKCCDSQVSTKFLLCATTRQIWPQYIVNWIFRQIFLPLYEYRTPDRLYSTLGQISLKIWAEFGVCRVKALGGVRVDNFCRRIIITR